MKYVTPLLLVFAIVILFPHLIHAGTCTLSVSEGESTIQEAINQASAGNTICIGVGTYHEKITLKNGITLKGEELGRTIIDGGGSGTVIIAADSTTINNITISNGEIGLSTTNKNGITVTNVIVVDNTTTGIECKGSTLVLENSVIDDNGTGILCDNATNLTMRNTIISNNSVDISSESESSSSEDPFQHSPPPEGSYHFNLIYKNGTTNYPTDDDPNVVMGENPLFVDQSSNDYHVKTLSPAIDAGDPDAAYNDADGTHADIGAYGGPNMDSIPYPVTNLAASEVSDNALKLTWSPNNAYNIAGYAVYFDNDASGEPYDGTSNEGTSPIPVGNVTTFTLTNLSTKVNLAVPTHFSTAPGDEKIYCSWKGVDGADGYMISYGTISGNYPSEIDVGNRTSYVIENLTNNVTYYIVVKAYAYPTYYLVVSAYDNQSPPNESALAYGITKVLSTRGDSGTSGEVSDYPEKTVPLRNLDDEYNCFIASAVYGSRFSPEVVLLRKFRDHFLRTNYLGRKAVSLYYRVSPPVAEYVRHNEWLKSIAKVTLLPVIGIARFCIEMSPREQMLIVAFLTFCCVLGVLFMRRKESG